MTAGRWPDGVAAVGPAPAEPAAAVAAAATFAPPALPDLLDDALELARFTRWTTARDGTRVAESSVRLGGMHCAACAGLIEAALMQVDGVVDARVSAAAQCASVRWDSARTQPSRWVRAIEQAGYTAVPDTAADARAQRKQAGRSALWRLFVAALCAMQVMMLATPSYVAAAGELAPDLKHLLDWGGWLMTLPVLLFSAAPFFAGAWRAVKARRIGMDVPVALGIAVAFVASSGAAFDPGGVFGQPVYFDSLTMFVTFLLAGRWLELRARHRAADSLESSTGRLPERVERLCGDGAVEVVSPLRLQPGDRVRVALGQGFPADGVLTQGSTRADEALLSGESAPVDKAVGDAVLAGSLNLGAPVVVQVVRVGADTRYEAILALMREAQSQRAGGRPGDRWAAPFLWSVLVLALGAGLMWSLIDPPRALWVAVSVLIVTCPCAFSLAAPSALLSAAAAMARRGVLLRRLDAIEGLARVQTLFVDKTGTLTRAHLDDVRLERADRLPADAPTWWPDAMLWRKAASLAAWSSHPLARVLARRQQPNDAGWLAISETPGQGLSATAPDGSVWRLGSAAFARVPCAAPGEPDDQDATAAPGGPGDGVYLSRDGQPLARFSFEESLRPGAAQAVRALRAEGVKVVLLSGDGSERVERLRRQLGLDGAFAAMDPAAKLAVVRAAQARGERVAMIGDGINDAPVLAQADVSLAMGEGAQVARAQADGVLLSNALGDVVRARALAQRARRVVRQNLVWAAAYNAACVPLAVLGWLPPWAAGLGMATSSLVVVLNSLRLAAGAD